MNSLATGWWCPRRRPTYCWITLLMAFSLALGVLITIKPAAAQPGMTGDPAADYQMWRDDEIFVGMPGSSRLQSTSYEYNPGGKTLSNPLSYCQPTASSGSQMAAAAGRIMSPYSDQVVVAYPGAANNIEVRFADACNLAAQTVSTGPSAFVGPGSSMPAMADPLTGTEVPWWYDIAAGDLDKHADANSNYRDEVVVAYVTPSTNPLNLTPVVAVLDYAENASTPTVTWVKSSGSISQLNTNWGGYGVPVIPLSVVTGDFDGDSHKEIAVAYVMNFVTIGVAVFRYTTTETDGVVTHSLNPVSPLIFGKDQPSDYTVDGYLGTIDTAAGDFDGDGKDELSAAAIATGIVDGSRYRIAVDLKTFKANADLTMTQVSAAIPYENTSGAGDFVSGVQLAAGLFKYAPSADPAVENFDFNRRQLALAANESSGAVDLMTLVYDANLRPTPATADAHQRIPASGFPGILSFRMAAGGFNGLQTTDSPAYMVSSLAFTTWGDNGHVLYLLNPDPSTGKLGAPHFSKTLSTDQNPSKSTSVSPVVAYDYGNLPTGAQPPGVLHGDSQYLGAPLYFRIDDVIMPDYILQEPPKHVYWKVGNDPVVPNCADKTVCNISGQDAFTLGTTDTLSLGMSSEYHDTYDHSWGVSETGSAELTYGSVGLLPPKFSTSLSETVGYDYADHVDDYNKDMTQRTVSLEHMATRDDAIKYRVQGIDVWRYPVFGADLLDPDGNPMPYVFFDVTAPAPDEQTYPIGGIDASDWYQPVHENGNILSYPAPVGGANRSYKPADMGSFQVPCTDITGNTCDKDEAGYKLSTKTITGPLLDDPTGFTWSGTAPTVTLVDSRSETRDHTHTWSKTLKNSDELKMTGRIPLSVNPRGLKLKLDLNITFNGKWSWGGAHTTEMKSDEVKTLKLSVPAGVPSEAYNVYPSFYVSNNGTTKVGFAVDMDTFGGSEFWYREYSQQPDPALNLPLRFNASTVSSATVWTPNTLDSRKLMRGFFVRHADADPKTGDFPEYDGPPTAGDQVRLEARVYNYSLGPIVNPLGGMKVRFDYVPIDSTTHVPDFTKRMTITEARDDNPHAVLGSPYTTIDPLVPRGMTTAVINWDTRELDFGGKLEQDYRIYVVLDPDNAVPNEKYETESTASRAYAPIDPNTKLPIAECYDPNQVPFPAMCIDPGQNNEGYRVVKVVQIPASDPRFGTPADIHLKKDALAARDASDPGVWLTHTVQAEEGQRLELRIKVDTDMLGAHYGHLLIYDGDPEKGGTLIAHKQAFTGDPDGSYVWAEWTPTEPGPHLLYAKVLESSVDDTQPGNAIDDLMVVVHKAKEKGKSMKATR